MLQTVAVVFVLSSTVDIVFHSSLQSAILHMSSLCDKYDDCVHDSGMCLFHGARVRSVIVLTDCFITLPTSSTIVFAMK